MPLFTAWRQMNLGDSHSPVCSRRVILIFVTILGAFVKFRKATVRFLITWCFLTVHRELTMYLLPTWCTDRYLFIKHYFPLHVSSLTCSFSGGYSFIHAAHGTVTLYESSWWPVGTQRELCTDRPPRTVTVFYE